MSDTRAIGTPERPFVLSSGDRRTRPVRISSVLPGLRRVRRFASPLVLVLLWQAASMAGLISPRTLAAPTTVVAAAWELLLSGELPHHLMVSLGRVIAGLSIGVSLGVSFALIAGLSRLGEEIVDAPLQMLRTLPFLALVPLFILWFGIGETPKIALVALGTTFPIYLTLFAGIRGVDPKLVEAGKVFGLDRRGLLRHVVLPGALPSGLVGLRYALGTAWQPLPACRAWHGSAGRRPGSTVWDDRFPTDLEAYQAAMATIEAEGIGSFAAAETNEETGTIH